MAVADAPFGRYWAAATISSFGTAVTTVAMPVLVIQELDANGSTREAGGADFRELGTAKFANTP
jgi:hypothetical protein